MKSWIKSWLLIVGVFMAIIGIPISCGIFIDCLSSANTAQTDYYSYNLGVCPIEKFTVVRDRGDLTAIVSFYPDRLSSTKEMAVYWPREGELIGRDAMAIKAIVNKNTGQVVYTASYKI